jgi:hypothetical protein
MVSKNYFKDYYRRNRKCYIAKAKAWKAANPEARARHVAKDNARQRARKSILHVRAGHLWRAAKKRGREFDLTVTDVETLLRSTPMCPYTKQLIDFSIPVEKGKRNPWGPSLERIDSSKGYVLSNVEITSVWWNVAKNEWPPHVMAGALAGLRL